MVIRQTRQRKSNRTIEPRERYCGLCRSTITPDYKDPSTLRRYVSDRGKIVARSRMGTCAHHQRILRQEIKRARVMALLPFVRR